MTIEVALVISGISLAFGIYSGITNLRRSAKSETRQETAEMTTVIVKLEAIATTVQEIKNDLRDIKDEVKNHSARIIRLEQQVETLMSLGRSEE